MAAQQWLKFLVRQTVLVACGALAAACSRTPAPGPFTLLSGPIVDLSHAYDAQAIFWPTAEPFRLDKVADGMTAGGYYYAANNFFSAEHGGTHLDAPIHFAQGHQAVDQVPLDRLLGAAIVVDVSLQAGRDPDYLVRPDDFLKWEQEHGRMPAGAILLVRTGFSTRWPDAVRYLGTAERGERGAANLHFPGLHPDSAEWLLANRTVKAVGIDTASIDYGPSKAFEVHRLLYSRDVPALENLTALERLPARGAFLVALPMKIRGGSGAPVRAIAILPR